MLLVYHNVTLIASIFIIMCPRCKICAGSFHPWYKSKWSLAHTIQRWWSEPFQERRTWHTLAVRIICREIIFIAFFKRLLGLADVPSKMEQKIIKLPFLGRGQGFSWLKQQHSRLFSGKCPCGSSWNTICAPRANQASKNARREDLPRTRHGMKSG